MNLPKAYEPGKYEPDIYTLWEEQGAFSPQNRGNDDNYCVVMPPPNANADLHIGYELTAALEDIVIRYQRMRGKATLLLPGADHAGFETQSVYEKHLAKEGKSRFDFTREELYQQIWDFVAKNRGRFEKQLRIMGASCDWSRYTFTLDDGIVAQAYKTFKKMWDEDLIYRSERLVNYCTYHGTGFADIEVVYQETKGKLWHINYPLTDGGGEITVATTRPETMLGDVAVAVHPKDKRYKNFIGKTVKLPLTHREIPILADDFVDSEFGTGAVKITPAHDPNDFEVAKRHDLPFLTVIGYDGKLNQHCPEPYQGLTVSKGRERVVVDLKEQGFLYKEEAHKHSVGHCYKCDTVIEPLLKEQWFVDMQPLAKPAIEALRTNKIAFYPRSKRDQLIRYLEGLRDWNISRQIAWGIPIPAFQNVDNPDDWIFDERVGEKTITKRGKTYRRDPDTFDTWFSSSSWPYSTLGGPGTDDFEKFYPGSLMETGGEILYQWVGRMIMLGLYVTGDVPFREVYIHGYIMAEDGSKMSKSLGNVVDPMPVIEKYGSDALRMGVISGRSPAVNRGYDPRRVEEARNFCNKLWNIARYIEGVSDGGQGRQEKTIADHWITNRLNQAGRKLENYLDNYRFSEAYDLIYHLVWDDVADWYIESGKNAPNPDMLRYILTTVLKFVHPFAPFVTETIWQTLHPNDDSLLMIQNWPTPEKTDARAARQFEEIKTIISEIRQIKTTLDLRGGELRFKDSRTIFDNADVIRRLAKLESVSSAGAGNGLALTQTSEKCWLDIDVKSSGRLKDSLEEKAKELQKSINHLSDRLENPAYVKKAPKKLVEETKAQLVEIQTEQARVKELIVRL
ncbi:MAG TPA: valine--tRNA ligase [Candidatus Saccharimonadales bacterium]|nr:valine--tRNA ligase [Candidatus Saccharimonadales bacterium]